MAKKKAKRPIRSRRLADAFELCQSLSEKLAELKREVRRLNGEVIWLTVTRVDSKFMPLKMAASTIGVPMALLRRMAKSGQIPVLYDGRRKLYDPSIIKRVLDDYAVSDANCPQTMDHTLSRLGIW
jgi:hypothetical protein